MEASAVLAKTAKGVEEVALTNPARAQPFRDGAKAYVERFLGGG